MNATRIVRASPMEAVPMPATLAGHLALVPDPRVARTRRHALGDILTVAVCAVLCGYGSYYDMAEFCSDYLGWLREWIPLEGGVPSHDTFRRVLGMVDPGHFRSVFGLWASSVAGDGPDGQVAIDGKALRGSADGSGSVQYIVNAWSARRHLVLGQAKVRGKANETVAIPELLPALDIRGSLVSIDAIGCQKAIAGAIRDGGGDYLLALKDNNPLARAEMEGFLLDAIGRGEGHVDHHATVEKGHGRVEARECWTSGELGWFADRGKWKDLRRVAMVQSTRSSGGAEGRPERRLYLCSKDLTAKEALEATRAHWGVESMHWVLDMAFDEDRARARTGFAAENLALIRRIAYNLLRRERDAEPDPAKAPRIKQLMRRAARKDGFRSRLMRVLGPEGDGGSAEGAA